MIFYILFLYFREFGVEFGDLQITLMRKFKTLLDPKGILNPYKVLPNPLKAASDSAAAARTAEAGEVF